MPAGLADPTATAPMSYGDYLSLDAILSAQHPRSPDHNEMLFIVQHQTSELWMKLMLHELRAAMQCVAQDQLPAAFKMLARVSKIMEQLVHAWDVLATMTPPEYSAIRPYLGSSSGFQSYQYRCIEFALGNKNSPMRQAHVAAHAHRPDLHALVLQQLHAPSLYDEAIGLMARRGLAWPRRGNGRARNCPTTTSMTLTRPLNWWRNLRAKAPPAPSSNTPIPAVWARVAA